jgi:hypothetical protein
MEDWDETVLPNRIKVVGSPVHGDPIAYAAVIGGHQIHAIWVDEIGLVKDLPTYGDPATYEDECPFLLNDNTCALSDASPAVAEIFWIACRPELCAGYVAEDDYWLQKYADDWDTKHPSCTYTWLEVSSPSSSPSASPSEEE